MTRPGKLDLFCDLIVLVLGFVGTVAATVAAAEGDWDTAWKIATVVLLMMISDELHEIRKAGPR